MYISTACHNDTETQAIPSQANVWAGLKQRIPEMPSDVRMRLYREWARARHAARRFPCESCNVLFHPGDLRKCMGDGCDRMYCVSMCLNTQTHSCSSCGKHYCDECEEFRQTCDGCSCDLCLDCSRPCMNCSDTCCSDCVHDCSSCGVTFCRDCVLDCQYCGDAVCFACTYCQCGNNSD